MAETALKFGPEWLRALSGNNVSSSSPSPEISLPKYKLADFRYGREEMLALFAKDFKMPDCLKEFQYLVEEKCQLPLALLPITEEEQRIWSRSINSDVALRVSGKTGSSTSSSSIRTGRGGSVDRGRGRGRGGYYQRGLSFEDSEDGPPSSFSRPKPMERSQSANEKDQRWDDRDRRFDRPFSGRGNSGLDDGIGLNKGEGSRAPFDSWRKVDKDDEGGWRTATRGIDKHNGRGSWRTHNDRDKNRDELGRDLNHVNHVPISNGPHKSSSNHKKSPPSGHYWDDDISGDNLPEWSKEESSDTDVVGTFDSTGAFHETKVHNDTANSDDIYASDDEDFVGSKECPESKKSPVIKSSSNQIINSNKSSDANKISPTQNSHSVVSKVDNVPAKAQTSVHNVSKMQNSNENPGSSIRQKNDALPCIEEHCSYSQSDSKCNKNQPTTSPQNSAKNVERNIPTQPPEVSTPAEEDTFAHHKKATETMVAQWTEEEEKHVISHTVNENTVDNPILASHNPDFSNWFYRDPQGEVQGPFTSAEMLEWFNAGYFTLVLLVRRGCDEKFSQLGELIETWGRNPFMPGDNPPPLRVSSATSTLSTSLPNPNPPASASEPKQDAALQALHEHLVRQQYLQQQLLFRHAQMQQLLPQMKQKEAFNSLTQQQQHQMLQQLLAQQQLTRSAVGGIGEQSSLLEAIPTLPLPLLGLTVPPILKNDLSLWGVPPNTGTWPVAPPVTKPPGGSIWDTDTPAAVPIDARELEKQMAAEEEKKRKQAVEELKKLEEEKRKNEERQKKEELERKQEEERLLKELKKQQEERQRLEELRKKEEERRQEELRKLEELRKEEERRKKEEQQKLEEQRKLMEEEQRKKRELERRLDEQRKMEEIRLEEARKQEEKRKQEEVQRLQWEKEQERLREIEREKEREDMELKMQKERERQRELERQKEAEQKQKLLEQKLKSQGPVWGAQNSVNVPSELSLTDIQKLQEEKEKIEREKLKQQQQFQQSIKQVQQNKNGLSWAKRMNECNSSVKSLAEIQQEEAERLSQLHKTQKPVTVAPSLSATLGVWGNTSQLSRITSSVWNSDISSSGFWDDALNSTAMKKQPTKTNDSAFPALSKSPKPANVTSNKNKSVRAKKEEEAVMKLFETHRKPTDEFTLWCTQTISSLNSSVDVPTFVAFLKDVESPYEVYDYVRSYLGESKEAREFGKQFLERRSKYRNQAKQSPAEENMWGPAPAITPAVKPQTQAVSDCDVTSNSKGKTKKRKNRMQKLDNSMLGFTVQSNPDRLNVGEIDRGDGM